MKAYAVGVDVGGTSVKLGLFSAGGVLLDKWEIPTRTENGGAQILPDIAAAIRSELQEKAIAPEEVEGIGIGVPGPVDGDSIVHQCINLGWDTVDVRAEVCRLLPEIPRIAVGNDANAAALGELWQGGGKGYDSAVMVTLGTGVGGGVVMHRTMVAGANGGAGEVGHMTVNPEETVPCACGKCGCLEQYASANGVVRMAKQMLAEREDPSALRDLEQFSAKELFDLARSGDALAEAVVHRAADYLGRALSYVSCAVDPEVYIIGGGVSRAGSVLIDAIAAYYRKYAFHVSADTPVVLAKLGNDAGIYGGARMVLS